MSETAQPPPPAAKRGQPDAAIEKFKLANRKCPQYADAIEMRGMEGAAAISRRAPEGNLSPHDIDELISTTSDGHAELALLERLMQFEATG